MTAPLTGGAAVVSALERNGVATVFGIPGSHNLEIYRHLAESSIEHVPVRHEQGGGYAADGYARAGGQPGVVITTTGPGLTNTCTPAATAYADSIPILLISPGVPQGIERADVGWLHEMKDQHAHLDTLVQRSVRVTSAEEAARTIDDTFAAWRVSRRRPVHLEVPLDVLDGPWSPEDGSDVPDLAPRALPSLPGDQVAQISATLAGARRPALVAGGGAREAADAVRAFAEQLQTPVVTTANGKGVLPESHPLSLGASIRLRCVQRFLDRADVLVVVGSELGDSDLWGGTLQPGGTVIRIDLDAGQLQKNLPASLTLQADAGQALTAILADVAAAGREDRHAQIAELRREADAEAMQDGARYRAIQDALRSSLPADAIVAGDSAQVSYFGTVHFWPMDAPGRFLYPAGFATLGYGLPAAIGAKLADRTATVATVVGDGGFLFTAQELATAAELGLCLPIVVVDNGGFAEIREEMQSRGIAPLGVDRRSPDFAKLAEALGGRGVHAGGVEELPRLVRESLEHPLPTVIALTI
ncbi:MAG TPA: thiamine pyrophosphate-binding protein [Solirubrobacteraceae bacterium]|nr:thiamine pyrophosphate-binding protein [Solirubrobacteraceae bacterium]